MVQNFLDGVEHINHAVDGTVARLGEADGSINGPDLLHPLGGLEGLQEAVGGFGEILNDEITFGPRPLLDGVGTREGLALVPEDGEAGEGGREDDHNWRRGGSRPRDEAPGAVNLENSLLSCQRGQQKPVANSGLKDRLEEAGKDMVTKIDTSVTDCSDLTLKDREAEDTGIVGSYQLFVEVGGDF